MATFHRRSSYRYRRTSSAEKIPTSFCPNRKPGSSVEVNRPGNGRFHQASRFHEIQYRLTPSFVNIADHNAFQQVNREISAMCRRIEPGINLFGIQRPAATKNKTKRRNPQCRQQQLIVSRHFNDHQNRRKRRIAQPGKKARHPDDGKCTRLRNDSGHPLVKELANTVPKAPPITIDGPNTPPDPPEPIVNDVARIFAKATAKITVKLSGAAFSTAVCRRP